MKKLMFFDFDRTIVSHNYPRVRNGVYTYYEECVSELTRQGEIYKGDRILPCIEWYMGECVKCGCTLHALTHEIFNLRDDYKKKTLSVLEGKLGQSIMYLTVDKPEHKIDMIKAIADVRGYDYSDCELVEDTMSTIYLADKAGIRVCHISDIAADYELNILNNRL